MEIGRNNPLEKPNGLSFGALYGLDSKANSVFSEIERIQRYFSQKKRHETNSSQRSYVPRSMVRTTRRKLWLYF
jgi:hypothetical protein